MTVRRLYPLIFFVVVTVLAFWKVIFHGEFTLLVGGDLTMAYFPWFDVAAYWLKKGVFILWDPYVYAGKSFMGEPQPGMFYPLNWVLMLLPARGGGVNLDGLQALLILDHFLAAFFFYLLARSFQLSPYGAAVAGISFALGGYTVQIYGYVNAFSGFVWMPLVLLCFRRALFAKDWKGSCRWTLGTGLLLGLTFLPGHHIPPVHTTIFMLFYAGFVVARNWAGSTWGRKIEPFVILAAVATTAVAITTVQWLASAEWARNVYRWAGRGGPLRGGEKVPYSILEQASNISPQDILSLVLPYVSTNANMYVGAVVVFLTLTGILFVGKSEAQFFTLAGFLYLFLSWGQFSALHGWLNTFVPGLWFAREVYYYLILFQVCLALLAGWGLDHLTAVYSGSGEDNVKRFVRWSGWAMSVLAVGSASIMAALYFLKGLSIDHPYVTASAGLATFLFVLGFLLFLLHSGRIQTPVFRVLIIAIVVLDLSSQISKHTAAKSRHSDREETWIRELWKETPAVQHLRELRNRQYFRVDDPGQAFPRNFGDVWRIEATMGHGATALVDYFTFRGTGWGPASNASALLNVLYFPSRIPLPWMKKVFDGEPSLYYNFRAVPRVFVASRYRSFRTGPEMLSWIRSPLLNPRETVLLRTEDLRRVPTAWLEKLRDERDGLEVRVLSQKTAAEKKAATLTDPGERLQLYIYDAPWGWSVGDELSLSLHPDTPVEHCFVIFDFYATSSAPSQITLNVESSGRSSEIQIELPGFKRESEGLEIPQQAVVDLGPLEPEKHRLSLIKTEACSANIGSLRIARQVADSEEQNAGTAAITSYEPNRLIVSAELRRPGFVVLSEVFYPGWETLVDGKAAPLFTGDYILRTVPVSEGKHTIELRYRPKAFRWGLAVTLLSLASIGFAFVLTRP